MLEKLVEIIESERKKQGMTRAELARKAKVSGNQLWNIVNGGNTSIKTLDNIFKVLEIKSLNIEL